MIPFAPGMAHITQYGIGPVGEENYFALTPGGAVAGAAFPIAQIGFGQDRGIEFLAQTPPGLRGLGAATQPTPGTGSGMPGGSFSNAAANSASTSTSSSYATGGTSNVSITVPQGGGALSSESAPFVLGLGGLGVFGVLLWSALKGKG